MELSVTTLQGESSGTIVLADEIFGLEPRADILHRMVRYQQLGKMAGTHQTRGRADIRGSTRKIVRQKGSGGARHGNRKVPQFRGGGRAFGPVSRSHMIQLPKKIRALALKHALSSKARSGNLVILDNARADDQKTSALKKCLVSLGLNNALIIDGSELDINFARAAGNIAHIDVLPSQGINVYDILRREKLVLTRAALESLEARFS